MREEPGRFVRIERTFAASAEEVFDAWTSPEVMRRWFHCEPDWATPVAEVDLRVGGDVRIVMQTPDGTRAEAWGEYTLIERPYRLAMTWTFSDDPSNRAIDRAHLLGVGRLDHGAVGEQWHLDRRAPRRPGPGVARVPRRTRAGRHRRTSTLIRARCGAAFHHGFASRRSKGDQPELLAQRALRACRRQQRWLCDQPWMNMIGGPSGGPHSRTCSRNPPPPGTV